MRTTQRHTKLAMVLITAALLSGTLTAGSLYPPTPPSAGGTMKTLDEVRPQIPIRQVDIPMTISASGSYYLTENVIASGSGILVSADNVTIDLCGFTLAGPDNTGYNFGINLTDHENVEIRNGTIRDFKYGIYETTSNGKNFRIINVRVLSNVVHGIHLFGKKCLVKDCLVADNGSGASGEVYGIRVGNGSIISDNVVNNNGYQATGLVYGISANFCSIVTGNNVYENGTEKTGSVVYGIMANTGSGISNNVVNLNGNSSVSAMVYGLYAASGCTVVANTACFNGDQATTPVAVYGFYIANECLVDQNTASQNNGTNFVHTSCAKGLNAGL